MKRTSSTAQASEDAAVVRTATDLAALGRMTGAELAGKYAELYGQPARTHNKDFLRKRLAWRIQELTEGGLSGRALARIEELAPPELATVRRPRHVRTTGSPATIPTRAVRDPRLPLVGTVLRRFYGGVEHSVTILDGGFEYQGETYRSLSKIARLVTGTPWNGYLFFLGRANGTKQGARG